MHSCFHKERKLVDKDTKYETPRIEDHGSLEELTAGQKEGESTDKEFPVHTPKKDVTFSTP
jgi:hypothetical protein